MIKPVFAPIVFALLMSLYMVSGMTLVITWVNTGLDTGFVWRWLKAFVIALPVAFLLMLFGASRIRRLVESLVRKPQD